MKTLAAFVTLFAASQLSHADYNLGQLLDSFRVAKAADSYVIEPKEVRDRPFTVQVASHKNEKEAIEHVEQLRVQESTVFYYPNFTNSQVYFKVCVGRFDTKEAAEAYRKDFMRRMDEPFTVTISLFDRPGEDKKATKAQVASAKSHAGSGARMIASVDANAPAIDLKKEAAKGAHAPATAAEPHDAKDVDVQLMKKANPVAAAAATVNAATAHGAKSYGLQVAAYPSEELAKAESGKVKSAGQDVYYKPADVNGKTWYRVYVGRFKTYAEAQAFQSVYAEQQPGQTIVRKFTK